jgi:hypothetical protein
MSSKSEVDGERSLAATALEANRPPSPARPPILETAAAESKDGVASDEPYSVFTYKEKWSIVGISSFAALFRRV